MTIINIEASPQLIYRKLDADRQEIRLVTIEPSSLDSAVRVTLRTVPHARVKDKYCCLSYAWGCLEDPMPILVDGHRHRVTANLYSLLRRLRALKRYGEIWIDALCINQTDLVEKESQVSIMQEYAMSLTLAVSNISRRKAIYSDAYEVLIGLDDSRECSLVDVPAQHAMAATTIQGLANDMHLWKLDYFVTQAWSSALFRELSSSFGQVLDSSWFNRTWVVQETCLAKKAILLFPWGELDWETFDAAFVNWDKHSKTCCHAFAEKLSDELGQACNRMYLHVECISYTRNGMQNQDQHIIEPMLNYQHLDVKLHRDKIYAFRGLHTQDTPSPIPDYTQPLETVYRDFLLWYFDHEGSLLLLGLDGCFGNVEHFPKDLPSWIPTWPTFNLARGGIERSNREKARGRFYQRYSIDAPNLIMDHKWDPHRQRELRLNSVVIDRVMSRAERPFTGSEKFPELVQLMKDWYQFAYPDHAAGNLSIQDMRWDFCATMLAGLMNDHNDGGLRHLQENDWAITEWRNALVGMEDEGSSFRCTEAQKMVLRSQTIALLDRVVICTDNGKLGLGSRDVEAGDEIFLLGGGDAPFLLRPIAHTNTYQLKRHCYVHGMMNGEIKIQSKGTLVTLV